MEYLKEGIDKVVILDADNLTDTDFLTRVNDITQDNIALQAHPYPQERQYADSGMGRYLREINNTIFRKGRVNVGISSSLIGSGMVFDFGWLKSHMPQCGTFRRGQGAGDLSRHGKYLCRLRRGHPRVREKTSRQEVMARQRSRWFHAQLLAFSLIIRHLDLRTLNWNYMDKAVQCSAPENIKLIIPSLLALAWSLTTFPLALKWYGLILISILTYTLAIPRKMHTRKLYRNLSKLPFLFFILTKGYIASFIRIKNKDTSFQSTPHDITIKKEESHD